MLGNSSLRTGVFLSRRYIPHLIIYPVLSSLELWLLLQVPSVLSWQNMYQHNNLYNTQCTFAIWAMKTITDGLIQQGGLKVVEQKVLRRAREVCHLQS